MNITETTEAPYGLTRDGYDNLYMLYRAGPLGCPTFGAIFGLACWTLDEKAIAICIVTAGVVLAVLFLAMRKQFFQQAAQTFRLRALALGYVQLCFASPAVALAARLIRGSALALCLLLLAAALLLYTRYYYRAQRHAWNEEKKQNEKRALDLEHGLYFPTEQFKQGDYPSLGWDERIGKVVCLLGPAGGAALGVVSGRGEELGLLLIGGIALSFFAGMVWGQMTAWPLINWLKIRDYERKIGKPIRNR